MEFKSGFVTIIGKPNVGKSTLMNALVKHKVAIVSPKVQTTRNKIQGVYTDEDSQIIFIDTPGIHKAIHELGNFMNKEALSTIHDSEAILLLIDATSSWGKGDEYIVDKLKGVEAPIFLVINKADLVSESILNVRKDVWGNKLPFKDIMAISALNGTNLDVLLKDIKEILQPGPKYYPDGFYSDHPESFIMAEIIREKILYLTDQEIPHSIATDIESITTDENDTLIINAIIIVERDSQKGIIIGKNGDMLKKIKFLAKKDIAKIFDNKVKLDIFVKVEKNWRNSQKSLKEFGYFDK
jgi:GTP-binding protein Era